MNHKRKTQLFHFLDLLPRRFGFALYHTLQRLADKKSLPQKIQPAEATFRNAQTILQQHGINLESSSIIEIGSGWLPSIPYFFLSEAKVAEVHTYDFNQHYNTNAITALNAVFKERFPKSFPPVQPNNYGLAQGVTYHPKTNLIHSALPNSALVFSRFVLEHVTPEDLREMHQKFKKELPAGTHILHFISPSDHRAHSDRSLSLQDFLQYSEAEWNKIQTKFDYHNRLRLPQYLSLFKGCALEVLSVSHDNPDPESKRYRQFKAVTVHDDFKDFTEEELTAGSIVVLLKT